MDERVETNRRRWDEMARLHVRTYEDLGLETAGRDSLRPFEAVELGSLEGKT